MPTLPVFASMEEKRSFKLEKIEATFAALSSNDYWCDV